MAAGKPLRDLTELNRLNDEFTELSEGHTAWRYFMPKWKSVDYVFTDDFTTSDLAKAESHLRELIETLKAGERLWW